MTDDYEDRKKQDDDESTTIDFGVILEHIGSCGRYQLFLVLLVYYIYVSCAMHQVAAVFIAAIPAFRCRIPGIDHNMDYKNVSDNDIMNGTNATENENTCNHYPSAINCSDGNFTCLNEVNVNFSYITCSSYVFDNTTFASTVVTEWNLVCERSMIATISTAVYYCGVLMGALVGGVVSDWTGRVLTLVWSQMGLLAAGVACSFSGSIITFAITRFLLATFVMSSSVSGFVYIMEITGGKWRTVLGIFCQCAFALGYMFLSPLAMWHRNWRDLQLAISLVSCPVIMFWFILPESPRWLISKGRKIQAKEIICKIAKRNNIALPETIWKLATVKKSLGGNKKYSPLVLLSLPRMRIVTLNVAFNWFVTALIYYGLSLNVETLAGSVYVNNVLGGVMEIAALPAVVWAMDRFGRRTTMAVSLLYGGLSCLAATISNLFSKDIPQLSIVASVWALSGKFAVSGAFALIYNFTAELYPTVVRSTGVGVGSMSARLGTIFTPFALHLQKSVPWVTGTIFGVLAIMAGGVNIFLPETKGAPLLTTLADAEEFYRQSKANKLIATAKQAKGNVENEEGHPMI